MGTEELPADSMAIVQRRHPTVHYLIGSAFVPHLMSMLEALRRKQPGQQLNGGLRLGCISLTAAWIGPEKSFGWRMGRSSTRFPGSTQITLYSDQLTSFRALYPAVPAPITSRSHCILWGDYDTQPRVEEKHGLRLDTNYYYWPGKWVKDRPGMFTGSGIPMRFATADGSLIDVYQATTQMTDESGQTYPFTIDRLLDNALGPNEFVGAFTANMHNDQASSPGADAIVASARARDVPVVAASQMLRWLDGRNASSFRDLSWEIPELHFSIAVGAGAEGLFALLPLQIASGELATLTVNGSPVPYQKEKLRWSNLCNVSGHSRKVCCSIFRLTLLAGMGAGFAKPARSARPPPDGLHPNVRQVLNGMAQRPFPQRVNHLQFLIAVLETPIEIQLKAVFAIQQQLDRRPHGHIRAHRRIERQQRILRRHFQARRPKTMPRSRIGRPYLYSPSCRNGESSFALSEFPCG